MCSSGQSTLFHCQVWTNIFTRAHLIVFIRSEHDQPMSDVPTFFPHELPDSHPQFTSLSFPTQIRIAPAPIGQTRPHTVPIGQIQQRPQPTQVPKICDFIECEVSSQPPISSTTTVPTTTASTATSTPTASTTTTSSTSAVSSSIQGL